MSCLSDYLPAGPVVLDASVIINLLGCGEMHDVLIALGVQALVEERTLEEIRRHPVPGLDHRSELDGLQQNGRLVVERMTDHDYEVFLRLTTGSRASRLDVGESAAITLALGRGHTVILDENKARLIVARDFAQLAVVSTFRMLLTAGYRGGWSAARVQRQLIRARQQARMAVPRDEADEFSVLLDAVYGRP